MGKIWPPRLAKVPEQCNICSMPIRKLLAEASFDPTDIQVITVAYALTCEALLLNDSDDPLMQIVAAKVIEVYRNGVHEPTQIKERSLMELLRE